jgi:predicted transposase/invertase (TIGR01784 family)
MRWPFEIAELAHLTETERAAYEESLKHYRDMINVVDTARMESHAEGKAEGREEGLIEGKRQTAREMKVDGMPVQVIAKYTGLSIAEIESLG